MSTLTEAAEFLRSMEKPVKERPILFSGAMVRAILSGQKTQTRRMVKGMALEWLQPEMFTPEYVADPDNRMCPYGQPGDRLWVREAWGYRGSAISTEWPGIQKVAIEYRADSQRIEYERPSKDDSGLPKQRECRADEDYINDYYNGYLTRYWKQWRPSIHMSRWACRLVLEIVSVRVERLQDISSADALAEGVSCHPDHHHKPRESIYSAVGGFRELWESINGPESWSANPWVWVVELKKVAA